MKKTTRLFRRSPLSVLILGLMLSATRTWADDEIQFNTDVLDTQDKSNIDLSHFSRRGYVMPGEYTFSIMVNKDILREEQIVVYPDGENGQDSLICLTPEQISRFNLKTSVIDDLRWLRAGECLDKTSLEGLEMRVDLAKDTLYLSIPQAWLEFTAPNWDPPSRWDDGIAGMVADYNLNMQTQHSQNGVDSQSFSGTGVLGANLGAWRARADWQANWNKRGSYTDKDFSFSRYYLYRAIPSLKARLTVGEDYLSSDIFDTFRFSGVSLNSDLSMLPPSLRGYAPEVTGISRSGGKVTISQQGRVLYETQVAAGPFRIQELNDAVSGTLDVRVEELDGSVQVFQVTTASVPYLTRPGALRYKLAAGKPSEWEHRMTGPIFSSGELSWGVANGWTLYGGMVFGGDYNALSIGTGRDLYLLGALAFDITQSRAALPAEGTLSGTSYRVSYSKTFDEYDSQVTFAGYRFSERDFMSMSEYLDARYGNGTSHSPKEKYTVSFNKRFRDLGLSTYINYSHQTYWNSADNDRLSLSLSRYLDIGPFKNMSMSLSVYRSEYYSFKDDGAYVSLSLPIGNGTSLSYGATVNRSDNTHRVSYYGRVDEHNSFQVSSGISRSGPTAYGYYTWLGDSAQVQANASYHSGSYSALGMNVTGGLTMTPEGGAAHRSNARGGSRVLVDTAGVSGVPVKGFGASVKTNAFGKAVIADVNSYYRNPIRIDVDKLDDNADITRSVSQATLTEGAIGYRQFDVISGGKAMAFIRKADGSFPPFGASVMNEKNQETGVVNDEGSVWLSGIQPNGKMTVKWDGKARCVVHLPAALPEVLENLLLTCAPESAGLTNKS
ncbi:outer membrane usher protein [Raoultella ornithinolytica]|uniref:outer membrane usher protein n=1 Tax=Raoultella ornithinolytica TaxID=54291 RepID=UPI0002CCFB81|nr:outer membrane usher protein [Raoultella ornithinolytica]AGJ89158.1 fimbrial biogenesis outer membrane usher protein [Raoultella ornithinolytica B6]MEB7959921.1 outer membrane usher protein [Raoultella ornithinolytica]HAT2177115.1 outer membrane usher protein [Raoultella ornithinolytica]HAT2555253.1 outer membrane usher protein [Raoultella ornithinolytica]HED3057342.1 outer membrane usher protein [Raoultella ornithinolytica]